MKFLVIDAKEKKAPTIVHDVKVVRNWKFVMSVVVQDATPRHIGMLSSMNARIAEAGDTLFQEEKGLGAGPVNVSQSKGIETSIPFFNKEVLCKNYWC